MFISHSAKCARHALSVRCLSKQIPEWRTRKLRRQVMEERDSSDIRTAAIEEEIASLGQNARAEKIRKDEAGANKQFEPARAPAEKSSSAVSSQPAHQAVKNLYYTPSATQRGPTAPAIPAPEAPSPTLMRPVERDVLVDQVLLQRKKQDRCACHVPGCTQHAPAQTLSARVLAQF